MSWADIRSSLSVIIGDISITSPQPLKIRHIYELPPQKITVSPCAVVEPPTREVIQRSYNRRVVRYQVRFRIIAHDADSEVGHAIADAFAEATLDAFDKAVAIGEATPGSYLRDEGGTAQRMEGPGVFPDASGKRFFGFDTILVIGEEQAKEFGT